MGSMSLVIGALFFGQMVQITEPLPTVEPPAPPREVSVHATPPPRGASDATVSRDVLGATAPQSGDDVLRIVPGVSLDGRGLPGRAPAISIRGYNGAYGEDLEMWVGGIPQNQPSNPRAPGYADMRFVIPETISAVSIAYGPYDPRQGAFALAGSTRADLGLEHTGFLAKGALGSFGTQRLLLAYGVNPFHRYDHDGDDRANTFAAFDTSTTSGAWTGRDGGRSTFLAQLGCGKGDSVYCRVVVGLGASRFSAPSLIPKRELDAGRSPADLPYGVGRDYASTAQLGGEVGWEAGGGFLTIGAYAVGMRMGLRQNYAGYVPADATAFNSPQVLDDVEQRADTARIGLFTEYDHPVKLVSSTDHVTAGIGGGYDTTDQAEVRPARSGAEGETRTGVNGAAPAMLVDATIKTAAFYGFADLALHPVGPLIIRVGARVDAVSYATLDRRAATGLESSAQGARLGKKLTLDYAFGHGVHALASYGDGFRTPNARVLADGANVPFAAVHAAEVGVRWKEAKHAEASLVAFGALSDADRVFEPLQRTTVDAPAARRAGAAAIGAFRAGGFVAQMSATYTYSVFVESNATYREGDSVPYAPRLVLRGDAVHRFRLAKLGERALSARVGAGAEGAGYRPLPGGVIGRNTFLVDAAAALEWHDVEVEVRGTNLLGFRTYDAQYVYSANTNVIVGAPRAVLATLTLRLDTKAASSD